MKRAAAGLGAWMTVALVAILIAVPSAFAEEPGQTGDGSTAPTGPTPQTSEYRKLSDEKRESRWAYVERRVWAYSEPRNAGRKVKRLTTRTGDHTSELVLVLSQRAYDDGTWVKVRLPMRPNNRTGWIARSALSGYHIVRTRLVIHRKSFKARLYKRGKLVWSARVGVGKKGTSTPAGRFYIRNRLIPRQRNSIYGAYAFGTSATSDTLSDWPGGGIIGVHGTNQPGLLPGRVSHGCIRVRNRQILRLKKLMPVGTPVRIF